MQQTNIMNKLKVANELYKLGLEERELREIERDIAEFYEKVKKLPFNIDYELAEISGKTLRLRYFHYENRDPLGLNLIDEKFTGKVISFCSKKMNFELSARAINFAYTLIDKFDRHSEKKFVSEEELKAYLIRKIVQEEVDEEIVKALFWLFGEEEVQFIPPKKEFLNKILYVFEKDNVRYYLTKNANGSNLYSLELITPENPLHNYIDKDRLFYGKVYFTNMSEEEIDEEIAKKIDYSIPYEENFRLIDSQRYKAFEQRYRLSLRKEEEEDKAKESLDEEIKTKFENLEKESFTYNGIKFTKNTIEYQGQKVGGPGMDLEEFIPRIDFSGETNFNDIYEQFVTRIIREKRPIGIYLGTLTVELTNRRITNKDGIESSLSHVNGIRINNSEVKDILMRAICFENNAQYEKLLKDVSKCNLQFHTIINNGIRFNYKDRLINEERYIWFKVKRKGNKNYLLFADKELLIRNTGKLINRSSLNQWKRYGLDFNELYQFFKESFKLDDEFVVKMFKSGLREYEEAEKRSRELLEEAIKTFEVKEVTTAWNGTEYQGYLINGKKNKYFLTKGLKIFEYPAMKHLCVIDKSLDNQVHNDKLVNRIYALANDELIAKNVFTLRQ